MSDWCGAMHLWLVIGLMLSARRMGKRSVRKRFRLLPSVVI